MGWALSSECENADTLYDRYLGYIDVACSVCSYCACACMNCDSEAEYALVRALLQEDGVVTHMFIPALQKSHLRICVSLRRLTILLL